MVTDDLSDLQIRDFPIDIWYDGHPIEDYLSLKSLSEGLYPCNKYTFNISSEKIEVYQLIGEYYDTFDGPCFDLLTHHHQDQGNGLYCLYLIPLIKGLRLSDCLLQGNIWNREIADKVLFQIIPSWITPTFPILYAQD